jgi:hypothetical protein
VTDSALEVLKVQLPLGKPPVTILLVTLQTYSYPLLLGEPSEGGSGMGVVAFKAEPVADRRVLAFLILAENLFMALSTVDHPQPLEMGQIFNIGMTIDATQLTVDRGMKLVIIDKEG